MEIAKVADNLEITLPSSIANTMGYKPGELLRVVLEGGRIELVPVRDSAEVNGPEPQPSRRPPYDTKSDPLMALFGTIKTDINDVAERHDEYIGQALFDELRGVDRG